MLSYSRSPESSNLKISGSNLPIRVTFRLVSYSFEISYAKRNDYILEPAMMMWKISGGCMQNFLVQWAGIRVHQNQQPHNDGRGGGQIKWVDDPHSNIYIIRVFLALNKLLNKSSPNQKILHNSASNFLAAQAIRSFLLSFAIFYNRKAIYDFLNFFTLFSFSIASKMAPTSSVLSDSSPIRNNLSLFAMIQSCLGLKMTAISSCMRKLMNLIQFQKFYIYFESWEIEYI